MSGIRVISFEAENFRNIAPLKIEPCDGINVICGDNGQGKTNLLEAIGLFSGVRSFRGAKNSQMIAYGKDFSRMKMAFDAERREQSATMVVTAEAREVAINGVKQQQASSLMGRFCTVVFSPDRMTLVTGGAVERRRFIDAAISQSSPRFAATLYKFNQILAQRNSLLKELYSKPSLASTLDVWDISLASYGAAIAFKRSAFIAELSEIAAKVYDGISSGKELLSLKYSCSSSKDLSEMAIIENNYLETLKTGRESDMKLGYTFHGPQRDDMEILLGGRDIRVYGSQGQKRSAVLALKLSEAELLAQLIGEQPVALLDDVMSELDASRQDYLLNRLDGWQVFITCCDPGPLRLLNRGNIYHMEKGMLTEKSGEKSE